MKQVVLFCGSCVFGYLMANYVNVRLREPKPPVALSIGVEMIPGGMTCVGRTWGREGVACSLDGLDKDALLAMVKRGVMDPEAFGLCGVPAEVVSGFPFGMATLRVFGTGKQYTLRFGEEGEKEIDGTHRG